MKSYKGYILILGVLLTILFLSQCTEKKTKRNPYLGKMPQLFTEYRKAKAPLIQKIKTTNQFGKELELKEEIEKLDRKYQRKFEREYKKLDFPLQVPYDGQLETQNLTLQNIYIKDITSKGRLILTAKVKAKKDNICSFMFARFTDNDKNPINTSRYIILTPPTYNKGEIRTDTITKGKTFNLKGFYNCDNTLAYAEKIVIKSEREYLNNN
ncbi:MAG: hypothetical protein K9J21_06045 [Bacteroidales bacterium]|nr:hypothetical protein [Bacteroidales bacterium]